MMPPNSLSISCLAKIILSWRRLRKSGKHAAAAAKIETIEPEPEMELSIPPHFRCPISLDLIKDPVTVSTGITYDRESIEKWTESGNRTCPVTKQQLRNLDQIPNHAIRKMIQSWCVENRALGVERIPTPRIPITRSDVSDLCSKISSSTVRGGHKKCGELVEKSRRWVKESERNRKCLAEGGAGDVLATAFEFFASISSNEYEDLLAIILSTLPSFFPLTEESKSKLSSDQSIRCMSWFLTREDLSSRQNSVLLLKELISSNPRNVNKLLLPIKGIEQSLSNIVKLQFCPKATKASLTLIYHIIWSSGDDKISTWFANAGFVSSLLELIVDSERSVCEKAIAVLDKICGTKDGKEMVLDHALTMPVMVKKLLRVSATVSELSVSVIWKLCKDDDRWCVEAIKLGCFQKLLVVLQVGCGGKTKEKATELLKMMNQYRGKLECFDSSMNYDNLKKPSF
ncbi:U-box domain-containing protein 21-like [Impatiens glandulifera]|uniref:U-box domain-containing protein 21-like n=1 Tax=Impatiens glandulifera TaxID=253017 RepID=UPI001FB10406|nr:U-box domain-containing protein 21-like [Impatiens glandulifera]